MTEKIHRIFRLQFIPARGRKPLYARCLLRSMLLLQFIPARGRKLYIAILGAVGDIAIYPREGTETCMTAFFSWRSYPLQFIPARGRKPFSSFLSARQSIAIYPREGTETPSIRPVQIGISLQFIPARGRKLTSLLASLSPLQDCNLSPRGDGNRIFRISGKGLQAIAIYPREGTETLGVGGVSRNLPIAIYPREGTETQGVSCRF